MQKKGIVILLFSLPFFLIFFSLLLLGSKTLGLNVLELQFAMLANDDQNILVLFRLAQSICFLCKVGIELLQNLLCNFF